MGLLIDSSVLIAIERRREVLDTLIDAMAGQELGLAAITASELLVGVHRAVTQEQRRRRTAIVESALERIEILPLDLQIARTHARLFVQLSRTGQMIGANDLLIAATALTYGYDVMTHDVRDFEKVPGLDVRRPDW